MTESSLAPYDKALAESGALVCWDNGDGPLRYVGPRLISHAVVALYGLKDTIKVLMLHINLPTYAWLRVHFVQMGGIGFVCWALVISMAIGFLLNGVKSRGHGIRRFSAGFLTQK